MSDQMSEAKKQDHFPATALLQRLVLLIEREAHLLGADIETEVASIITKLNVRNSPQHRP